MWDHSGALIHSFEEGGHSKGVSDVAWSPDSTLLASASDDCSVIVWSMETVRDPWAAPS